MRHIRLFDLKGYPACRLVRVAVMVTGLLLLLSCSMTKNIPDDEQLFAGLTKIAYADEEAQADSNRLHLEATMEEVEAALATAPNGALFGSSYYRVPWSWRLWVYNKYSQKDTKVARWLTKTFGRKPVLMSQVNPALRVSVARSVLRNNGYFRGDVSYETVTRKNPKEAKIAYTVHLDSLFMLDSVAYTNFPDEMRRLIDSTASETTIRSGAPFSVSNLEAERTRLTTLLRNNGYYYFNSSYASFLADTFLQADKVQLQFKLANGLQQEVMRKWYVGNISLQFRRNYREQLTDSIHRRHLRFFFNGKRPPIRPRVVLKDLRLFPRQPFSYQKYQETVGNMNSNGIFSSMDFQFTPRAVAADSSRAALRPSSPATNDTLDLNINCIFDKPYDFYVETNLIGRTIGRYGPEMRIGFTKRNAFRGGEKLDINLHGNYEWQRSGDSEMNSFQYGADASIEFPRILAPFYNNTRRPRTKDGKPRRRTFFSTPTTLAKASTDIIRRPGYYKMHIASGEWTYRWQSSPQSRHEFSPLTVKYQFINTSTEKFDSIRLNNPYIAASMEDQFITKMRYTYIYNSPTNSRNPIRWETTLEEAGNGLALYDMLLQGHEWSQKGKTFFKNPYAQFLRAETDFTKTWQLPASQQLVGHVNAGVIWTFGNSTSAPFSETFYAGGANSIRAFTVRSIGPGELAVKDGDRQFSYMMQNGEMRFVANLEYRARLFGDLNGAVFIDVGNVWNLRKQNYDYDKLVESEMAPDIKANGKTLTQAEMAAYQTIIDNLNTVEEMSCFRPSRFFRQLALGTGAGLRYDLGFLVIRIDWGLALHAPYDTGRSGYFNINRFRDAQTLHFAIGYPF